MMQEKTRRRTLLLLALLGLTLATLAGASEHVKWLASLCGSFGDGCKETTDFTLFRLPIWLWGVGYYIGLVLLILIGRPKHWLTWFVAVGIGVEVALVWVMISMNVLCIFCLGNLIVMALLAIMSFERERFWQTLSICLLFFMLSTYAIPQENELYASTEEKKEKSEVVAVVGGREITHYELEIPLASQIIELQRQIYQLKKQRLEELIAETVLEKEASGRGITPQELIKEEVTSKGVTVSDEEVEAYLRENRARITDWRGSMDELKGRIRAFLEQQKAYAQSMTYAKSLEPKFGVSVYLKEPQPLQTKVNIEGSPSVGPDDAPVVVVEFSDYECPACRAVHETVRKVREVYPGRIKWVFKDFPLKMHQNAERAAQAGRCAAERGKFWEYQDLLYGSKEELTSDRLIQYAGSLGLDPDQFKQCLDSGKYVTAIEKEKRDAKLAGVDRTPTFVINGKLYTGAMALERFKELIDRELNVSKPK